MTIYKCGGLHPPFHFGTASRKPALLRADTLAGEINSGTIQTIVTKPIRRADVVLGKWLGSSAFPALATGGIVF